MQSEQMQDRENFSSVISLCQWMAAVLVCAAMAIPASAQTFVVLHKFSGDVGTGPSGPLVQGLDGFFYGTTVEQGSGSNSACSSKGCGTVFRIGRYGEVSTLYSFCNGSCSDGANPEDGLAEGPYGTLYGTTVGGGLLGSYGTVFKITPQGALTTLYKFCELPYCNDGAYPGAANGSGADSITLGWDGGLHGTALGGGVKDRGVGTLWRLTLEGKFSLQHIFCRQTPANTCPDGQTPSSLIQATDGNLYGITYLGGIHGGGTVFRLAPDGFSTLHDFCSQSNCADAQLPTTLIESSDGNLYGTTRFTVFKLTTAGTLTTLYTFPTNTPTVAMVQGTDGNFYVATNDFVTYPYYAGDIFRITPEGAATLLHVFNRGDGYGPTGITQGTDGAFYGTTEGSYNHGTNGGTIYRLDVGLKPFVRSVVPFGHVGDRVSLLGTDLAGVSSVSFNGTPATIISSCATHIATTVPEGATSGPITVTTATGTLTSNVAFTVLP